MDIIKHAGKTIAGDLQLSFSTTGIYFAVGRLDGGINFSPRFWVVRKEAKFFTSRTIFGPFDLMWSKNTEE